MKRFLLWVAILGILAVVVATRWLIYEPVDQGREPTPALMGEGTNLAKLTARLSGRGNMPAAFVPLVEGNDALGARLRLIEAAERSIDIKTFLIKPDRAGALIWLELFEAAERGVRVRLLFDDVFTTARDDQIAALDAHPNVEIRTFNPLSRRIPYVANFLLDFSRVNRRMHNKAMIVDGSFAILGGRNIADEYYQIGTDHEFADFDLLVAGSPTHAVSEAFDTYWNDYWAVPIKDLAAGDIEPLRIALESFQQQASSESSRIYRRALNSAFLKSLGSGEYELHKGNASVVVDSPDKLRFSPGRGPSDVSDAFYQTLAMAEQEVVVMTPYFVPGQEGAHFFATLANRGVAVRIVTNSLASSNHAYVHGGYAKYRAQLLTAGVEFLEVRADAPDIVSGVDTPLTMHTKLAIVDRKSVFAGSSNVDPRSFDQNTEIGIVIDSPSLAENILRRVDAAAKNYTFSVNLGSDERIVWHYDGVSGPEVFRTEPGAGAMARILAWFSGWLPVEGQL